MIKDRRYACYISYNHADAKWAAWLQKNLEGFRTPSRLAGTAGEHGRVPARISPVFRDRDDLASASDLGRRISLALESSDAMVVICSPSAASSRWVNEEIRRFRRLGRGHRIHCLLVDGGATAGAAPCFPPALVEPLDTSESAQPEPIAADLRDAADGRALALQKLQAGLLGVGLDDLRRREAVRKQQRLAWITAASLAGMAVAGVLAAQAHFARNDALRRQAQAEDLLGFMIDDLRPKLQQVGKLELLDAVGDKAEQYFASLQPQDQTDMALAQQARSLTQIGQVRLDQGNHDAALAAFASAHDRARELAVRLPRDGERLFDLAQAEYWLGLVAWRQGDLEAASRWLRAYRDRSEALVSLDPSRFDWQLELAYGYHNLAVLDDSQGRHAEAAAAFESEVALYRTWLPQHPGDTQLQFEAANAASWLGSVLERQGRLVEAEAYFSEADSGHALNQQKEPEVLAWTDNRIDTTVLLAKVQARQGKRDAARARLLEARDESAALVRHDPENAAWQRSHGNALTLLAAIDLACGDRAQARLGLALADPILARAYAAAPKDELVMGSFARAALVGAELALKEGRDEDARVALERARAALERAWQPAASDTVRLLFARLGQLEGDRLANAGSPDAAMDARQAALQRLGMDDSGEPRFAHLEQAILLRRALGKVADANRDEQRLQSAGGRILDDATTCQPIPPAQPAPRRTTQ